MGESLSVGTVSPSWRSLVGAQLCCFPRGRRGDADPALSRKPFSHSVCSSGEVTWCWIIWTSVASKLEQGMLQALWEVLGTFWELSCLYQSFFKPCALQFTRAPLWNSCMRRASMFGICLQILQHSWPSWHCFFTSKDLLLQLGNSRSWGPQVSGEAQTLSREP